MRALRIQNHDNVAVAMGDIAAGEEVPLSGDEDKTILARDRIPFTHKIALQDIERSAPILKYGVPVAFARESIRKGEWVHTHNADSYFAARKRGEIA